MDSIWFLGMLVVGGMGSTLGAILGVVVWRLLEMGATQLTPLIVPLIPVVSGQVIASMGIIIYALVIISFIVLEPRGLAHRWQLFKASYRLHPFPY